MGGEHQTAITSPTPARVSFICTTR
jgi:hypothetical protein